MKVFEKKQFLKGDGILTTYSLFGIRILSISRTVRMVRYYLVGLRVFSKRSKINDKNGTGALLRKLDNGGDSVPVVWIDHSLGGGTEVYSRRQIENLRQENTVVKIQYFWRQKQNVAFVIEKDCVDFYFLESDSDIEVLLSNIRFEMVVVNSVVGFERPLEILRMLGHLRTVKRFWVRFNLHDYHSICPNFNLMCKGEKYCELDFSKCRDCFSYIVREQVLVPRFLSGVGRLDLWRKSWLTFLSDTCDQIVAFSNSSKNIFTKIYPIIASKIDVFPHVVPHLRSVKIKEHCGLNVAFLGSIYSDPKGRSIVKNLVLSNSRKEIKFFVIGDFVDPPDELVVVGKYEIKDLPDIIEERMIDLIIIPSICPETFSYTTSEAMQLNIPVACFDIGAQAEKVKCYGKKIIFTSTDPKLMLREIGEYFCLYEEAGELK